MKSFEVQVRRSGQWKTDSTYDDRELAEVRARQIDSSEKADPVRVVEEVYQERTKKYQLRTVYRGKGMRSEPKAQVEESILTRSSSSGDEAATGSSDTGASKQADSKKEPAKANGPAGTPGQRRGSTPPNGGGLGAWGLLGILALLVGLGIGAMIALEYILKQA